jgi:hypothetical protein
MNLLKLPNLKADKNNKFFIDLVNKLNGILSSFEKTLTSLTYTVDNIDADINKINENYVKELDIEPFAITGYGFKNFSYIIENDNGYFVNVSIDLYPPQGNLSLQSNTQVARLVTNLDLTNNQSLQFITYNVGGPQVFNLTIGANNIIYVGDNGMTCLQYKTGKIFGTIIIKK